MIVIVMGLPGSGKSYFASRLATMLAAEYINSDKVRKELGAMGRYSLKDRLLVYHKMATTAERFLVEGRDVVVDATFHLSVMRSIFLNEAEKLKVRIQFILVWAKEGLIHERLKVSRADSEADFSVYMKIRDQFEKLTASHLELESTRDNVAAMLSKGMNYIKEHE